MPLSDALREQLSQTVTSHKVVLFMKGKRRLPQCGFSAQLVKVLDDVVEEYHTINVLEDPDVREGIKEFSSWPTIPQLYVNGSFVGGCDIVTELYRTGELHKTLGVDAPTVEPPTVSVTEAAAHALKAAMEQAPEGSAVRLEVDGSFRPSLGLDSPNASDFQVQAAGITLIVDRMTARRADGIAIDFEPGDRGGFRIDNPNEPPRVRNISPDQVSRWQQGGEKFEFIDVRGEDERSIAKIEGTQMYTPEVRERLMTLPKDTPLVFTCHHGGRSLQAAQEFVGQGFRKVYNLEGGIDAWALQIDNTLTRY